MSEWQLIETAPKDGTIVLLARRGIKGCVFTARYHNGLWMDDWLGVDYSNTVYPTHWQPLPAPPEKEGEE